MFTRREVSRRHASRFMAIKPFQRWDPLAGKCTGYSGQACFACYTGPLCKTKVDNCTVASLVWH